MARSPAEWQALDKGYCLVLKPVGLNTGNNNFCPKYMAKFPKFKEATIVTVFCLIGIFYQTFLLFQISSLDIPAEALVLIGVNLLGIVVCRMDKPWALNLALLLIAVAYVLSIAIYIPGYSYPKAAAPNQKGPGDKNSDGGVGGLQLPDLGLPGGTLLWVLGGAFLYFSKK